MRRLVHEPHRAQKSIQIRKVDEDMVNLTFKPFYSWPSS